MGCNKCHVTPTVSAALATAAVYCAAEDTEITNHQRSGGDGVGDGDGGVRADQAIETPEKFTRHVSAIKYKQNVASGS